MSIFVIGHQRIILTGVLPIDNSEMPKFSEPLNNFFFFKKQFYFLVLLNIDVMFLLETGSIP